MSPRHPFIRVCQAAEDAACRDADRVVSILPRVHAHLAAHGLDLRRLVIVPNGIDPADWSAPSVSLRADLGGLLARLRAAGRTVVGYTGSMGLPNALDVLLDAAALLRDQPLDIVLVGDGHERERLVQRIDRERLGQVHWLPPVPKDQIPTLLRALDMAYLGWQRMPIYRFGIAPNKLMDYMAAGCAVLHSVEAGNDPVAETGCGLSVAAESPRAVADGLRRLAALTVGERARLGRLGHAHVMAHHTWSVLAARFLDGLQS
jgi:glycosyltransferase involved in cell wall biosynthesis